MAERPPRPPTSSTGTLLESCRLPDHMLEMNIRHELSSTVDVAFRHRGQPAGQVRQLADVIASHPFVGVGIVFVRSRMMGRPHVEEGIEESGKIAAQQQRGDARLVGLEGQRDDVAHQPHVFADVFGKAVVGTAAS